MEIVTNEAYWDCACLKDYIHPKTTVICPYCGALAKDQPDSRSIEVEELKERLNKRQRKLF